MKEVILCKYGEIVLKGANRYKFEAALIKELKKRARLAGRFRIFHAQSTVFIEPESEDPYESDIEEMYRQAKLVFGFSAISRAAACPKNIDDICRTAGDYLAPVMKGASTFRCEAKRSDKTFPLKSPEISAMVGASLLRAFPGVSVSMKEPDVNIRIEVREKEAYIHAGQEKAAGGIPLGASGRGLLLLSGGIDSPVAGYMMAKRGLYIDALYFESIPYTNELAREKVVSLATELCDYCSHIRLNIISLTKIQEEIRDRCVEDYFTLILRRFMVRLACRLAREENYPALITGESLGQVASQTLNAIASTENASDRPIFRPLIGTDKDDIVKIAREIGTYDTSILPYEDCCTVFTPRHPKTNPSLEAVIAEESKLDVDRLLEEAWESKFYIMTGQGR